jgi:opacity protein-like surface antigen
MALLGCLWANAIQAEQRWYTAGTLSIGAADLHNSSSRGTLGTGQLINGLVDGQFKHSREVDTVAGIGASFGRTGPRWSLETETLWRVRTDWDLAAPTPSIRTVTNIHTNINNITLLLNLSRHWGRQGPWQWHVGGGIGVAFNRFETDYKERAIPGESDEVEVQADSRSEQFAWNLSAGVSRQFNNRWQGRLRYRYMDLGNLEVGPFEGRSARVVGRHSVHELQLTLVRLWFD